MGNDVLVIEKTGTNVFGLKIGQAQLYNYLLKCYKEGKTVEMNEVCIIYYTYTATRVRERQGLGQYKMVDGLSYYHGRLEHLRKNNYAIGWAQKDARTWLKMNIGSFVLRGMLTTIPRFNPKEVED